LSAPAAEKATTCFAPVETGIAPLAGIKKALQGLDRQMSRQLPAPYFMIPFTVPESIGRFFRNHQAVSYDALFQASSEAIKPWSEMKNSSAQKSPAFSAYYTPGAEH
jgi:hypothetical protein